ncbi:MAG: DUF1629 domain-containing protein [Cellulophaga sp.]
MKYYSINKSYKKDVIGQYPQQIDIKLDGHIDNELFIDNCFLKKVDFVPLVANVILNKKAKLTDLISSEGIGFSFTLLISSKLKEIFNRFDTKYFQFFKSNVILNDKEFKDYWIMNPIEERIDKIDYKKSEIYVSRFSLIDLIKIDSWEDFQEIQRNLKVSGYKGQNGSFNLSFKRIVIKESNKLPLLYFRNKMGGKFHVSEKLKTIIESENCTGLEFMPSDLDYKEWSAPGGYREKVYGL